MTFAEKLALKKAKDKALYERKSIILDAPFFVDTYLVIRYQRAGVDKWVHYINHIIKSNGKARKYREMYSYFASQTDFIAGYGYVLYDHSDSEYYEARYRYFVFDKLNRPTFSFKKLKQSLFFRKAWCYSDESFFNEST